MQSTPLILELLPISLIVTTEEDNISGGGPGGTYLFIQNKGNQI